MSDLLTSFRSTDCPVSSALVLSSAERAAVWLARCAGDECGDDVGGVTVERDAGTVVSHRGARVGVTGGLLDVAQRNTGIQRGSDEGVPQRVRSDALVDPGATSDAAHDPGGAVPVEAAA